MIYVASPIYGSPETFTLVSYFGLGVTLGQLGVPVTLDVEIDSNQARARNVLFHRFLESKFERLLMIDADMTFTKEDFVTLFNTDEDAVTGIYQRKQIGATCVGEEVQPVHRKERLLEMSRIGFGFLMLKRLVVEKMAEHESSYFIPDHGRCVGKHVKEIVGTRIDPESRRWLAVDDVFSEKWRALGGKIWAHTGVILGHVGNHVFHP